MGNLDFSKLIVPGTVFGACLCLLIALMIVRKRIIKKYGISDGFVQHVRAPIQIFIMLSLLYIVFESLKYHWIFNPIVEHIYAIIATICFGCLAIKIISTISSLLLYHFDLKKKDNYLARQVHTRIKVLNRLAIAFIVFFVILGILMTFESIRAQGTNLLASAGVLSLIIGLAAQKTMSHFFAGIQIAIAQPIRVDDVVVVENEWGRIEEIHLTFVVVKLWDFRRLIVPITYFTDHVFQNWTQKTADLLGAVILHVDYTMPIQPIREELDRLLKGNSLWDGRVKVVQVTNATENGIEIRILTSSANSGTAFDLKCAIREHMIAFIQNNYPASLPRRRTETLQETQGYEHPDLPKDPVRAPAPTLGDHPKPMPSDPNKPS